jgi:hypothetical protein
MAIEGTTRFVFVLGAPRSGTTMIGALLGSAPQVFHPGEYFAFYASNEMIPRALARVPSTARDAYLKDLAAHAVRFAATAASAVGAVWFCDATPWNLLIASTIRAQLPRSVFVLCVRHPAGVIQSLTRSFAQGYRWAMPTVEGRARLYDDFYSAVDALPASQTMVFDCDAFCARPQSEITDFTNRCARLLLIAAAAFDFRVINSAARGQFRIRAADRRS